MIKVDLWVYWCALCYIIIAQVLFSIKIGLMLREKRLRRFSMSKPPNNTTQNQTKDNLNVPSPSGVIKTPNKSDNRSNT